jgi:hypothetical protein
VRCKAVRSYLVWRVRQFVALRLSVGILVPYTLYIVAGVRVNRRLKLYSALKARVEGVPACNNRLDGLKDLAFIGRCVS